MSTRRPPAPAAEAAQEPQDAAAALVARVEALEAVLAGLSGPGGSIVTGSVAVVDEFGRPVVVLSPSGRPVEVLEGGRPAVRFEVDGGHSSLHLRHGSAGAMLGVRAGTSQGATEGNGALLRLNDGAAGAELAAVHHQQVTGAGLQGGGRADLTLHGSDVHGGAGAKAEVVATDRWAEASVASHATDEDRACRVEMYAEHEETTAVPFVGGQAFVQELVPDPPAWSR